MSKVHKWHKKGHCYYQCEYCKNYKKYHENYGGATCTTPKKCECGEKTSGSALGHRFSSSEKYCGRGCGTVNPNYVPPVPAPSINDISFSNITYNSFKVTVSASNAVKFDYLVSKSGSSSYVDTIHGTTSRTFTVTGNSGLEANTVYKVGVNAYNSAGVKVYRYNLCTTASLKPLSTPSATYTPTIGGVKITWSAPTGANSFHYTLIDTVTTFETRGNQLASTGSVTVTNLVRGREYKVYSYYTGKNGYANSPVSSAKWFTTLNYPTLPSPSLTCSPSLTSVTISWSPPTGAQSIYLSLGNATQSQPAITKTVAASNRSITITGLYVGCRYNVYAYYIPQDGYLQSVTSSTSFNTTKKPTFHWSTSISSGGAFNIKASDWNKMCATINTWRSIKGLGAYSFTSAKPRTQVTASMYNQVRTALSPMTSAIPRHVNAGDKCVASEFKKFETAINNLTQ